MTEERNDAVASLKEEIAKNDGDFYKFSIKGLPDKGCALFYNGKEVYAAEYFHRVKYFVFDVFDHSPSVVGKWDFEGHKNVELAKNNETEVVIYKDDLKNDTINIKSIADKCKPETRFVFSPFKDDEETNSSRAAYGMWHCKGVPASGIACPVADMETEIVVPTLVSAFEQAGIAFGKNVQDLVNSMVVRLRIPFTLAVRRDGFDVTFGGTD